MRILFVCSRNRLRSPTAEAIFAGVGGVETCSAGTADDAEQPVTAELVEWADLILVMEEKHRKALQRDFRSILRDKRIACLGIPDDFDYMAPDLIELLWQRVPRTVPILSAGRPDGLMERDPP